MTVYNPYDRLSGPNFDDAMPETGVIREDYGDLSETIPYGIDIPIVNGWTLMRAALSDWGDNPDPDTTNNPYAYPNLLNSPFPTSTTHGALRPGQQPLGAGLRYLNQARKITNPDGSVTWSVPYIRDIVFLR